MNTLRSALFGLLAMVVAAPVAADCDSSVEATTPTSRFTDNGDGTVTDSLTTLTWKRCPEVYTFVPADPIEQLPASCTLPVVAVVNPGFDAWSAALQQAETVNGSGGFAGHTDWRVPNAKELGSVVERQCMGPSINEVVFPDTSGDWFWTSTPGFSPDGSTTTEGVLAVSFWYGTTEFVDTGMALEMQPLLRLVRGGP